MAFGPTGKGRLWLANKKEEEGVIKISIWKKTDKLHPPQPFPFFKDKKPFELDATKAHYIHRDQKGYWYTNLNRKFYLFDSNGEWMYNFSNLLNRGYGLIFLNHFESEDHIWWGSPTGVLKTKVKKNPFQLIHSKPDNFSDCRGLTEDEAGNIYFSNNALFQWNPQSNETRKLSDRLSAHALIYQDSLLWSCIYGGDILGFQLDLRTNEEVEYPVQKARQAFSLLESNVSGNLLVGTDQGLEYIDLNLQKVMPYDNYRPDSPIDDLLRNSLVYYLHKNQAGIWAATDKGIFLIDENEGVLNHFDTPEVLLLHHIRHIYEDANGVFWLATLGGGIIRWQTTKNGQPYNSVRQFSTKEGLSNDYTYAIYEDAYGKLWISSDKGLVSMNKSDEQIRVYLTDDGLPHNEFNLSSHYQAKDGTLYFGGLGGLISFHPRLFKEDLKDHTPLRLTGFYLLEGNEKEMTDRTRGVLESKEIVIKPTDKLFELHFSLLDYDLPEKHLYAYQIEGYSNHWHHIKENFVRITNLPYGGYTLKIKGKHNSKGWSEQELSLRLRVLKPFYLQWWFIITLLLIGTGIVFSVVKKREIALEKDRERLESEVQKRTLTIQQQAEELKALDRAKTRFFSNVTHEFRTPLTLIIGPLEQVISEQPPPTIFQRRLNGILKNSRHLLNLINQMLDISKIESGRMEIEVTSGDIITYTKELISRFQPLANKKGLGLYFVANQDNWSTHFDQDKWDKIIYNLLSNAIKFTKDGEAIQLSLLRAQKGNKEFIRLDIKDSGKGIEKIHIPRIFDRFYQADPSATRTQGGTGIGLALVKELVEMQGGELWVWSKENKGTSFEIHLPILEAEQVKSLVREPLEGSFLTAIEEKEKPAPILNTTSIDEQEKLELLIIEDDNEIREYIHYCVDTSKYNITEAGRWRGRDSKSTDPDP